MKRAPKTPPDAEKPKLWRRAGQCLYVYQPSGEYYARARIRGKLKSHCLETRDRKLADRKLRKWKDDQDKLDPNAGDMTIEGLVERYGATLRGAEKTVSIKRHVMRQLLGHWPQDAPRRIARIRQGHIKTWLAGFGFGASAHNAHLWTVRAMFAQAVADKIIPDNPAEGIPNAKRERPRRMTPSWEQFRAIVENVRGQRWAEHAEDSADLVEFMGLCGVGQAEAAGLCWKHVDFAKGEMLFFRVKTRTAYAVPIFPQARPLMERLRDAAGGNPDPEAPVFKVKDPKIALEKACKRLGFPHYSPRSLRRMFITRCLTLGVSVKNVAHWQGHQDGGALILRVYSHVIDAHAQREAAKLVAECEGADNVLPFAPAAVR
ncbi:MAG: tyrosine-type recombinase/integrase [Verrucomicrobiae bacterium]|nr:tyrosine-type recombinase/integrase [Verrucomicrobiae bacterium]